MKALKEQGTKWHGTCFYGFADRSKRRESWALLRTLKGTSSLIIGTQKMGVEHPEWLFYGVREAIGDYGLIEIGLAGHDMTWEKRMGMTSFVEEKLDKAFVTSSWLQLYPNASLHCLLCSTSDHHLIQLTTEPRLFFKRSCKFGFENVWLRELGFKEVMIRSWGDFDLLDKIQTCIGAMWEWGKRFKMQFR